MAALGEFHDRSRRQGFGQRLHSWMERIQVSRRDPNGDAGQRVRVSDCIVGGEVRGGGVGAGIGSRAWA